MNKEAQLRAIIEKILELTKWLDACPAEDGQPFYETAVPNFEALGEAACDVAEGTEWYDDIVLACQGEADWDKVGPK